MSAALLLKFWREALILVLAVISLSAIKACSAEHNKSVTLHAQQEAIVAQQKKTNEDQKRHDDQTAEQTKHDYEQHINQLNSDHRIASLKCMSVNPRSRPMPSPSATGLSAATEARAELPQPTIEDFGPRIDALTRECDAITVQNNALIDFVLGTR